jgi:tetratricopeptide (TPR) repeat protein
MIGPSISPASPFLFRDTETAKARSFVGLSPDEESRVLRIGGESGTGKSTFCKSFLCQLASENPAVVVLYLDLPEDNFATSNLYESLICLAWSPHPYLPGDPLSVPPESSFSRFGKGRFLKSTTISGVYQAIRHSVGLIPGLKGASDVLPSQLPASPTSEVADPFIEYIRWLSRRKGIVLALDNYQFLSRQARLRFESRIGTITQNLLLVLCDRWRDGKSDIEPPLCFSAKSLSIAFQNLTRQQTASLIAYGMKTLPSDKAELLAQDCFYRTRGNLKEIELYLNRYRSTTQLEPWNLAESLDGLPILARSVLVLTSIFTAGLKRQYVEAALRKLAAAGDSEVVDETLRELVALGYIVINGASGETVRASHEKIITATRHSTSEEEVVRIRRLILQTFDELIGEKGDDGEYFYVLHCLVGILHLNEALTRLERVVQLVENQHRLSKYEYVAQVFGANLELVAALPESTVRLILDAFQKTSQFSSGQVALQKLRASGFESRVLLDHFLAKYLVQTYRPREALEVLRRLERDPQNLLVELNARMCVCEDQAAALIVRELRRFPSSEELYVGLRNSAHLFSFDEARDNLMSSKAFFSRKSRRYMVATVLSNLGIVFAWNGNSSEALQALLQAHELLAGIGSDEAYQSEINLGCVATATGDFHDARSWFAEARSKVPRELLLDRVIIDMNSVMVDLLDGHVSLKVAKAAVDRLSDKALAVDDPRFVDQVSFNVAALNRMLGTESTALPSSEFEATIRERERTGYELLIGAPAQEPNELLIVLSPHWRY